MMLHYTGKNNYFVTDTQWNALKRIVKMNQSINSAGLMEEIVKTFGDAIDMFNMEFIKEQVLKFNK